MYPKAALTLFLFALSSNTDAFSPATGIGFVSKIQQQPNAQRLFATVPQQSSTTTSSSTKTTTNTKSDIFEATFEPVKQSTTVAAVPKLAQRWRKSTKQLATLGPASSTKEMIEKLFLAGADVFRLNFSHGSQEQKKELLIMIREIEEKYSHPIAVLGDLQGPKLRVCMILFFGCAFFNPRVFGFIKCFIFSALFGFDIIPFHHSFSSYSSRFFVALVTISHILLTAIGWRIFGS